MPYIYSRDFDVSYASSFGNLTLSLTAAVDKTQDALTYYFGSFGGDNRTVLHNDNAVWVISRTRLQFHGRLPEWGEPLHSFSYTVQSRPFATRIETVFTNDKGEKLFSSQIEACSIDMCSHTNNSIYVRYLMNALSVEELRERKPRTFEINYRKEVLLGETFGIYTRREGSRIHFMMKNSEKEIAAAPLSFQS